MGRAKQVTDEQIIAAAMRCAIAIGPSMTLADVGEQVELSAATVVQRFGTKRELMRAVVKFRTARVRAVDFAGKGDPITRVIDGMCGITAWMKTKEHVANYVAVLHTDLADPESREMVCSQFQSHRHVIAAVLDEAVASGLMKPCDTLVLARLLQATVLGAQQSWAIAPQGELPDWVAQCLHRCIAPWLTDDEA
jgi:AcrR family transcriptional regulator